MAARAGGFGTSLRPFGGGTLNLDDAYAIGELTATPSAPTPAAPPPVQYGGPPSGAISGQPLPIVGATPVPPGVLATPTPLQPWAPTPLTAAERRELQRRRRIRERRLSSL